MNKCTHIHILYIHSWNPYLRLSLRHCSQRDRLHVTHGLTWSLAPGLGCSGIGQCHGTQWLLPGVFLANRGVLHLFGDVWGTDFCVVNMSRCHQLLSVTNQTHPIFLPFVDGLGCLAHRYGHWSFIPRVGLLDQGMNEKNNIFPLVKNCVPMANFDGSINL